MGSSGNQAPSAEAGQDFRCAPRVQAAELRQTLPMTEPAEQPYKFAWNQSLNWSAV
ncbi:MAG: hypothetical protein RL215_159 [Planctomycetota bacterium]